MGRCEPREFKSPPKAQVTARSVKLTIANSKSESERYIFSADSQLQFDPGAEFISRTCNIDAARPDQLH